MEIIAKEAKEKTDISTNEVLKTETMYVRIRKKRCFSIIGKAWLEEFCNKLECSVPSCYTENNGNSAAKQ